MELAPLALPAHPDPLAIVPAPPPVEEEEALVPGVRHGVALVEARDPRPGHGQDVLVAGQGLRGRVRPVGEEGEADVAVRVREVVHLEPLDLLLELGGAGQQGGHDDQGAQGRRHPVAQLEARQGDRRERRRDAAVQQGDRQIRGRKDSCQAEQDQGHDARAGGPGGKEGRREKHQRQEGTGAQIAGRRAREIGAQQLARQRLAKSEGLLEGAAAVADEVIAGVASAVILARARRRQRDHARWATSSSVAPRASRELLDGVAVAVAGGEVHRRIADVRLQHGVDQADALEELLPVERGHEAHARDHVADGDVHRGLPLVLDADDVVGRRALGGQPLGPARRRAGVTPDPDRGGAGRAARRRRSSAAPPRSLERPRRALSGAAAEARAARPPGRRRPAVPRGSAHDALREAPEILDEHDAQADGDRPQLADGQRLHALVGLHEAAESVRLDPAVGVRDEGPGDAVDLRIAERAGPRPAWAARGRSQGAGPSRISRSCSSTRWKLSTNHSAAGVIARSSRMALAIARYPSRNTRPFASTRGSSERPLRGAAKTGCAVARLSACCSKRSLPKSSARIGASSCLAAKAREWEGLGSLRKPSRQATTRPRSRCERHRQTRGLNNCPARTDRASLPPCPGCCGA